MTRYMVVLLQLCGWRHQIISRHARNKDLLSIYLFPMVPGTSHHWSFFLKEINLVVLRGIKSVH
jgi:hypothetical protein